MNDETEGDRHLEFRVHRSKLTFAPCDGLDVRAF